MPVEYEIVDKVLKINARNWAISSSIEDSEAAMAVVIDRLMEAKDIEKIIISDVRDNEYDYTQVKILKEIADAYEKLLSVENILNKNFGCEQHAAQRVSQIKFLIFEVLRKDPILAYARVNMLITLLLKRILYQNEKEQICSYNYLNNVLYPIKEALEATTLIQRVRPYLRFYRFGDRTLYREIFFPIVRPSFMQTSFKIKIPFGSELVDKYYILDDTLVQVFKVPGNVRYLYLIIPPEFRLSEEDYKVLDLARKYLVEHKPLEEITEPEKTREIFIAYGKDLIKNIIRDLGLKVSEKIDTLASILARYTAGFGVLELLLSDEKVQDVVINSPIGSNPIYIYHSDFEECETNLIPSLQDAESWATRFRLYSGRPLDEANPVLDTELNLPWGRARVAAITKTLSPYGLAFAFRRHRERPWTFPLFMKVKYFDPLFAGLMSFIIDGGRSLLIAGGRSSGKTSLLNACMLEIMRKFRIIVQEDTLELNVPLMIQLGYNVQRLKSRSVITKVEIELPPDEALRTALRLGDSALIVGEVRSSESVALFEAMRIGALAHTVAGTIHGESAYGVYDRVVNDLGVKPTSFKAIDLIVLSNMLRSPDGLHRFRRVVEVTELRKKWKEDPLEEGAFVNLMEYSAKEDRLKPTDILIYGESEILNEIAKRVREWKGAWDLVWENILLRAKIKQAMVNFAEKLNRPEILEADWVVDSNEVFHLISDQVLQEVGSLDSKLIYERWLAYFKEKLKARIK
ncbi:MAG: type II/IV secretion system ATPase subunit [Candidatus Aenigmatarchaeota archaeon]